MEQPSDTPVSFLLGAGGSRLASCPGIGATVLEEGLPLDFRLRSAEDAGPGRRRWRYDDGRGLELELEAERRGGDQGVLSARLRNRGPARTLSNVMWRLDFATGPAVWRCLSCAGGLNYGSYPPPAFAPREESLFPNRDITSVHGERMAVLRRFGSPACGRASNQYLPLLLCALPGRGGFWYGMEWSCAWYKSLLAIAGDPVRFRADAGVPVAQLALPAGDELEFPPLHAGAFAGGFSEGGNHLRRYLWDQVVPDCDGRRPLPSVTYDSWFGLYNDADGTDLHRQLDRAADLGAERFCCDGQAWGDFPGTTGNWDRACPRRFPDGFEPLAEHARRRGLDFGLWFEIECTLPGSWAARTAPGLFIPDPLSPRGPMHLDLSLPAAQDWAIEVISRWVARLNLRWIRYDYNLEPARYLLSRDPSGRILFGYSAGLHRVLDQLRRRHPALMIENSAAGGRRITLGTLARSHTNWFSDATSEAHACRWMQLRSQRLLPGHAGNSSFAVLAGTGADCDAVQETLARCCAKLSFDGDVASLPAATVPVLRALVGRYQQARHLLVGDLRELLPVPLDEQGWDAVLLSARDGSEHLLAAFRTAGPARQALDLGLDGAWTGTDLADGATAPVPGGGLELALPEHSGRIIHLRRA